MIEKELTERLLEFLDRYYEEEIVTLAQHYPKEQRSLYIDYQDLWQFDPDIADDFQNHPHQILNYFHQALANYDLPAPVDLSDAHVRIYNLSETIDVSEVSRKTNIGRMISVTAQVEKVGDVDPRLEEGVFECLRCGTQTTVPQSGDSIQKPHECQGCERQGPFELNERESDYTDHQKIRIQQPPERAESGNTRTITVNLNQDLIKTVKAGDRVTVTGVLETKNELNKNESRTFDTYLKGHAIEKEESDYEEIDVEDHLDEIHAIASGDRGDPYQLLVDSINPEHQGDRHIKLAIALQLFGGWSRSTLSGSRVRGDSHVLLVGDPSRGKSTFLGVADSIAPRSTYASGQGASASGLTAAVVSDDFGDTEWSIEAGALVLADGGLACIDEIDKVGSDAVSSMHDALESQQVQVNKAGLNATLPARTSLLAAGNPREGRFDEYESIAKQIDLSPTLLSRFDLIFILQDRPEKEHDREVAGHKRRTRRASAKNAHDDPLTEKEQNSIQPAIDPDVLRAYIAHARRNCKPKLVDKEAEEFLIDEFLELRLANDGEGPVPITFRKQEAIERLAEASARVRLDDEVRIEDVERALSLVKESMKQVGIDPDNKEFDADIVETGQSMSQRERKNAILEVLKSEESVSIEELDDMLEIPRKRIEDEVKSLKQEGRIYEPDKDTLRKT